MANQVGGVILDFVKSEFDANKPAVLAAIAAGEGGVEAFIVKGIKNAPRPNGILGSLFPLLEGSLENYVQKLVAANGPEVVFDFIDRELADEAKALGG
jgi:hypothetical protein